MRGDLDLHFHQSISPLSEGNLVDLDLGVLGVSPTLFFLSSPPINISFFWWDLRVKDLSLVLLPLLCASVCALHEDSWKLKACELVTLGSLDPRRPCGG